MRRAAILLVAVALTAACDSGATDAVSQTHIPSPTQHSSTAEASVPTTAGASASNRASSTRGATAVGQLHVRRGLLMRAGEFRTESCCHWLPQLVFHAFRGDTADPCAMGRMLTPRVRFGIVSRLYEWRGKPPDDVDLGAARVSLVKLVRDSAAQRYYRHYVREAFSCPPRHLDGGSPDGVTAVYRVVHRSPGRTVVADRHTEFGATLMARYIDIRHVGRFVAIVEYQLGEDIDYEPDLRRVTAMANAQERRLRR